MSYQYEILPMIYFSHDYPTVVSQAQLQNQVIKHEYKTKTEQKVKHEDKTQR